MDIPELKQLIKVCIQDIALKYQSTPVSFHEQEKNKNNMAVVGFKNESIWFHSRKDGFVISLSGESLNNRMFNFMVHLFGDKPYTYEQPNNRQPAWKGNLPELIRQAIFEYAKIPPERENNFYSGEMETDKGIYEGALKTAYINSYERNPIARKKCIEHFGLDCIICGFNFENKYGKLGSGFIHVHHVVPISSIGEAYQVDPIRDLVPVCPNCHAMLHKGEITIDQLKATMVRQ